SRTSPRSEHAEIFRVVLWRGSARTGAVVFVERLSALISPAPDLYDLTDLTDPTDPVRLAPRDPRCHRPRRRRRRPVRGRRSGPPRAPGGGPRTQRRARTEDPDLRRRPVQLHESALPARAFPLGKPALRALRARAVHAAGLHRTRRAPRDSLPRENARPALLR